MMLANSTLFTQDTFYTTFLKDVDRAEREIIIESPFVTVKRLSALMPALRDAVDRGVRIIVNTKPLEELEPEYYLKAQECIIKLQEMNINVLATGGHHRKIAIIDKRVLYEGSLNILSQNESCEIMRRTRSRRLSKQMINFLNIKHLI